MRSKSAIGVFACLVLMCLTLGAAVLPDGATVAADESLNTVNVSGDASEQGLTSKQVNLLRVISVFAMAVFLAWYIRRKMKL